MTSEFVVLPSIRTLAIEVWHNATDAFASALFNVSARQNTVGDAGLCCALLLLCFVWALLAVCAARYAYNAVVPFIMALAKTVFYAGLDALINLIWMACFTSLAAGIWCFVLTVLLMATKQVVGAVTPRNALAHALALFWATISALASVFH